MYISALTKGAGTLFVSMGMMEVLKRNLHRVAFFRPIISSKDVVDGDIDFMLNRYDLDMTYEDAYGFDIEYVEKMIASDQLNTLINQLITKFKRLENSYDFVLCEGIRRSFLTTTIDYDLNLVLAQNFGTDIINIINANGEKYRDIYEDILIQQKNFNSHNCSVFATFVNRLNEKAYKKLEERFKNTNQNLYLFKEVEELNRLNLRDVIEGLDAEVLRATPSDYTRVIRKVKVGALSLENFLDYMEEDDLVIVPADRSDIIVGLLCALYSSTYPNISAIVFPYDITTHPNILKLVDGLEKFNIPIISVTTDTYKTTKNISKLNARIRVTSERKIALALGLFHSCVDVKEIENRLKVQKNNLLTPMMFEYQLFEKARLNKKTIVLPESSDERILRATETILRRGVANIILLGKEEEIVEDYLRFGLDLSEATIIDHENSKLLKRFTKEYFKIRRHKELSMDGARDAMLHINYFATMMVHLGYADGMVSGAIHSTGDTIRPAFEIVKTTPDTSLVSSVFFMCLKTKVLIYGDCAINQDPSAMELAQIALSSSKTAQAFGIVPKVAMLSYSTGGSAKGKDVDKVRQATHIIQQNHPTLLVEGPIQYDAAVEKKVAKLKLPNSKVAGEASVLIFPDLNTGNNTYKAVQRSSGAIAIGPILQGLNKPINDLSRGCQVTDIVNTVAITAIQAGQK